MAQQLRGPFEKFVGSPYLKNRPSPHLHKFPTRSNKVSPRTFQAALVYSVISLGMSWGGSYVEWNSYS
jgi:hypothetical protein